MKNIGGKQILAALMLFLFCVNFDATCFADKKASKKEREDEVSKLDLLYDKFLTGTSSEARTALRDAVALIQGRSTSIPELQSALIICYARLSLLERRAGNDAQSRLYFEKSRYWRIVESEKIGRSAEDIIHIHDSFLRDDSDSYALEWDKKQTKGEGPAYLKNLK